ncbi:hypothetical protein BGW80DRAFT_1303226 [Lactifluus volemus]|nr:hypothetical protein BGW80DRAFT_1303226 [Lactifluus volemus]
MAGCRSTETAADGCIRFAFLSLAMTIVSPPSVLPHARLHPSVLSAVVTSSASPLVRSVNRSRMDMNIFINLSTVAALTTSARFPIITQATAQTHVFNVIVVNVWLWVAKL